LLFAARVSALKRMSFFDHPSTGRDKPRSRPQLISSQLLVAAIISAVFAWRGPSTESLDDAGLLALKRITPKAALLPPRTYYVALNLHNNAEIVEQACDQLLLLAAILGNDRVFVSIREDGSNDGTGDVLERFARALTLRGIKHSIVSHAASWRELCPLLEPSIQYSCSSCDAESLRDCLASVRIPVMALLRNLALLPLYNVSNITELNARAAAAKAATATSKSHGGLSAAVSRPDFTATHLGFSLPTYVVFLNDVILYAEDIIELISTEGGQYDLACGMDFDVLQLYDTWVARDLNGATLSGWFPFVRERTAQAKLIAGQPFRVYSCWNGAVALPAAALVDSGLVFRSWTAGEPRSPHVKPIVTSVWSDECPASECHLICKDLWSAGHSRIFMNPRVRLAYNVATELKQRVLMPLVNSLLLSWSNRIGSGHHSLRSSRIRLPVGSAHTANGPFSCLQPKMNCTDWEGSSVVAPPVFVSCGLSDDDLRYP
jgi:hypothetical protein